MMPGRRDPEETARMEKIRVESESAIALMQHVAQQVHDEVARLEPILRGNIERSKTNER